MKEFSGLDVFGLGMACGYGDGVFYLKSIADLSSIRA
jgi:hypothetical protein